MSNLARTDDLFFNRAGLDRARVEAIAADALAGTDDGELFLEYAQSESIAFEDGRVRTASYDTAQGFGLRAVVGETTGYAHAAELGEAAIERAAATVRADLAQSRTRRTGAPRSLAISAVLVLPSMSMPS